MKSNIYKVVVGSDLEKIHSHLVLTPEQAKGIQLLSDECERISGAGHMPYVLIKRENDLAICDAIEVRLLVKP